MHVFFASLTGKISVQESKRCVFGGGGGGGGGGMEESLR